MFGVNFSTFRLLARFFPTRKEIIVNAKDLICKNVSTEHEKVFAFFAPSLSYYIYYFLQRLYCIGGQQNLRVYIFTWI